MSTPSAAMKICPYEKNKTRNNDVMIPDFLLFVIRFSVNHKAIVNETDMTSGIITSSAETLKKLFANRNKIGNMANRNGWNADDVNFTVCPRSDAC